MKVYMRKLPGKKILTSSKRNRMDSRDQSLSDLFYSTTKASKNGGRRSTFAGNSALFPSDAIDFAMLSAQTLLAGNSFIIRRHVTSR